jgi:hypothetical protein
MNQITNEDRERRMNLCRKIGNFKQLNEIKIKELYESRTTYKALLNFIEHHKIQ